jgi:hypothetical protein
MRHCHHFRGEWLTDQRGDHYDCDSSERHQKESPCANFTRIVFRFCWVGNIAGEFPRGETIPERALVCAVEPVPIPTALLVHLAVDQRRGFTPHVLGKPAQGQSMPRHQTSYTYRVERVQRPAMDGHNPEPAHRKPAGDQ